MTKGNLPRAVLFIVVVLFHANGLVPNAVAASETQSVEAAKAVLEFEQAKQPDRVLTWEAFTQNYTVSAGRVEKEDVKTFVEKTAGRDMIKVRKALEEQTGFRGLKIRSDYSDVLSSEDPTVTMQGSAVVQSASDLKGASFSFERDFREKTDTWAAKGALLFPFLGRTNEYPRLGSPMRLTTYGVIPSISFDRETNSTDETKNVDSLIFRVGAFAKFMSGGIVRAQTFRLFASYGTDFRFNAETLAAEFEYEPVIFLGRRVGTGSTHSLLEKTVASGETQTILAYQLRAYLHGEYGRITNPGNMTPAVVGDFFRWGPKCELTLDPLFTDRFAASLSYQHLANVVGDFEHNHSFKASVEYRITTKEDANNNPYVPLVSLKASYENGGVDLSNARVRTLLVGLGVTL